MAKKDTYSQKKGKCDHSFTSVIDDNFDHFI